MLTLIVGPRRQTTITADGRKMRVYQLTTWKDGRFQVFHDTQYSTETHEVQMFCIRWRRQWPINLSPDVSRGIAEAVNHYHAKEDLTFDCYAFVNLVRRLTPHRVVSMCEFWVTRPRWFSSRVGDIVFLVNNEENYFYHAAVYIGFGLYLSILGAGGDLEVMTLEDMKRDFGASRVLVASPRIRL